MRNSRGTGHQCPILILFLALMLICSTTAFAQWQGANNIPNTATANASDNTNTATVTAVTTAADGSSATYTINPIVNNNGGVAYLVGDTLKISVKIGGVANAGLSVNSRVSAVTTTSVTVTPPAGKTYPVSLSTAATGTLTLVLADPTTSLPGETFGGDVHCLTCHSMPAMPNHVNPLGGTRTAGSSTDCTLTGATSASACGPLDANGYLLTGHRNILRKVLPTQDPSGAPMATTGNDTGTYPGSDSAGNVLNWLAGIDMAGGTPNSILYELGWTGSTSPAVAFWLNGTGPTYTAGANSDTSNYQCARCHTTGYRFDGVGPEPTYTQGTPSAPVYNAVTDAMLKRVPAGWTSGKTSSWQLTGIQCERCHGSSHTDCNAAVPPIPYPKIGGQTVTSCNAWQDGSGTWRLAKTYQPVNVAATALCIECHRQERNNTTQHIIQPTQLPGQNLSGWPAIPGVGSLGAVSDSGSCSVSHTPKYTYSQCLANGGAWNFKPSMSHGANGAEAFLNSPHARFTGTLQQNAQNSPDLSVQLNGTFSSYFTDWGEGVQPFGGPVATSSNNGGCTGCHNPHYSTVATATPSPTAIVKHCQDCHTYEAPGRDYSIKAVNHPVGEGTPLPNGLSSADSSPCVVCHLAAAGGAATYHYFRINEDPNYYTFGPASAWYASSDTPGNGQPNTYAAEGRANYPAVGLDVDIACGQCHVGGNGTRNTYGIVPAVTNAPAINRADLAAYAQSIHATFVMKVPPSATGTRGQPLGVTITLSPRLNGFFNPVTQGPVTLSASGLPGNATYSWSANPVTPVNGGAISTLTITVPATTAQLVPPRHVRPFIARFLPLFGIAIGSVVLAGNKKKRAIWVVLGLVLLISLAVVGCGGGAAPFAPVSPTAQSFTVTVNATSGSTTVSSTIPVTMH